MGVSLPLIYPYKIDNALVGIANSDNIYLIKIKDSEAIFG